MKAPAFQWYAAEYLADEQVAQLSLESEAVYVRLLSYCWREGTIPANPLQCVALCKYADVKVIKPALNLFIKAPGQPGRLIHKRLEEERTKQQAFKDKQLINGKLGGRPRKPNDNPDETQTKGLGCSGLTQTEPKKRSSSSTSSTTEEHKEPMPISAAPSSAGLALKAIKEKEKELDFISFWLTYYGDLPKRGSKAKAKKQWLALDAETRALILAGLEAHRADATRKSPDYLPYATTFLSKESWKWETYGQAPAPVYQTPNQVPGNWNTASQGAYTAPMGQGIPHPNAYLKPEFQTN